MGTKELEILLCEISFVNTFFLNIFTSKKISEMFEKKITTMHLICQYTNTIVFKGTYNFI